MENISERSNHQGESQEQQMPVFKDLLASLTFKQNRALPSTVRAIELGSFADEANSLLQDMEHDPYRHEHAKRVIILPNRRILIERQTFRGSESSVVQKSTIHLKKPYNHLWMYPKEQRQDRFYASIMHTHPLDYPPSPIDLHHLLLNDASPFSGTAAFIITTQRRFIIFRGPNTPFLTDQQVSDKVARWESAVTERLRRFVPSALNQREVDDIHNRTEMALLRDISRHHDLNVFIGTNASSRVQKHIFS